MLYVCLPRLLVSHHCSRPPRTTRTGRHWSVRLAAETAEAKEKGPRKHKQKISLTIRHKHTGGLGASTNKHNNCNHSLILAHTMVRNLRQASTRRSKRARGRLASKLVGRKINPRTLPLLAPPLQATSFFSIFI